MDDLLYKMALAGAVVLCNLGVKTTFLRRKYG